MPAATLFLALASLLFLAFETGCASSPTTSSSGEEALRATSSQPPEAKSPTEVESIDASTSTVEIKTLDAGLDQVPAIASENKPNKPQALAKPFPLDPSKRQGLPKQKKWPFFKVDKAQAFTFNLGRPGRGLLQVVTERAGWNPSRVAGPMLTKAQMKNALRLSALTEGEHLVSKCAYPRHGIVFYSNEVPVGSISICFECGDILSWPAWRPEFEWNEKKQDRYWINEKGYKRSYPKWKQLFESQLGLDSDWKKLL